MGSLFVCLFFIFLVDVSGFETFPYYFDYYGLIISFEIKKCESSSFISHFWLIKGLELNQSPRGWQGCDY